MDRELGSRQPSFVSDSEMPFVLISFPDDAEAVLKRSCVSEFEVVFDLIPSTCDEEFWFESSSSMLESVTVRSESDLLTFLILLF